MILLVAADEALQMEIRKTAERELIQETLRIHRGDEIPVWGPEKPRLLLVDLGWEMDAGGFIEKMKLNPATKTIPLVAFGNSLRSDLLQDAQEAGADLVLSKSAFRRLNCRKYSGITKKPEKLKVPFQGAGPRGLQKNPLRFILVGLGERLYLGSGPAYNGLNFPQEHPIWVYALETFSSF